MHEAERLKSMVLIGVNYRTAHFFTPQMVNVLDSFLGDFRRPYRKVYMQLISILQCKGCLTAAEVKYI